MSPGRDPRYAGARKRDPRYYSFDAGVVVTPAPALIALETVDPTVIVGGPVSVTPAPALIGLLTVNPTVIAGGPLGDNDRRLSLYWRV